MSGWTLLFIFIGATFLTVQLFHLIDVIERPARRRTHRRAY